jgi:hypothetical protein
MVFARRRICLTLGGEEPEGVAESRCFGRFMFGVGANCRASNKSGIGSKLNSTSYKRSVRN